MVYFLSFLKVSGTQKINNLKFLKIHFYLHIFDCLYQNQDASFDFFLPHSLLPIYITLIVDKILFLKYLYEIIFITIT